MHIKSKQNEDLIYFSLTPSKLDSRLLFCIDVKYKKVEEPEVGRSVLSLVSQLSV